jgi:hypothetical protein
MRSGAPIEYRAGKRRGERIKRAQDGFTTKCRETQPDAGGNLDVLRVQVAGGGNSHDTGTKSRDRRVQQ